MTKEEKQLLLKDLCARLPYEVKGLHRGEIQRLLVMDSFGSYQVNGYDAWFNLSSVNFKPYLRSMSSMTEEEENEYREINCYEGLFPHNEDALDYVLSHHFDYRGLIEKGLALEAPGGTYKTE